MKYQLLNSTGIAANKYIEEEYEYLISGGFIDEELEIKLLSRYDYTEIANFIIPKSAVYYLPNKIVTTNLKAGYKEISLKSKTITSFEGDLVPRYEWLNSICYLRLSDKSNIVKSNGVEIMQFKDKHPEQTNFCSNGILKYLIQEKVNNWIKLIDTKTGKLVWVKDFQWQIIRLNIYNELIILDYHAYENKRTDEGFKGDIHWTNRNVYTIVLNSKNGEEIWRTNRMYSFIDRNNKTILTGGINTITEFDLFTGDVKHETEIKGKRKFGVVPHFTDSEGIYFVSHKGEFGKLIRNGEIEWEFKLMDINNEERILSELLLLENGKLVINALPNHKNGDLSCIFDPKENLIYSKKHWL